MELQVEIPSPPDFNFHSGRSSPRSSASSTPKAFGRQLYFLSAPASPSRATEFYQEFEQFSTIHNYQALEERKSRPSRSETDDFAFLVSADAGTSPVSAEELFHGGRIRSFNPPPDQIYSSRGPDEIYSPARGGGGGGGGGGKTQPDITIKSPLLSPSGSPRPSPKPKAKKSFWSAFTPRKKSPANPFDTRTDFISEQSRGRERASALSKSSSGRRATRSLSPHRESNYPWEEDQNQNKRRPIPSFSEPKSPVPPASSSASTMPVFQMALKSSRRWRLKDFLLFRSASEGRASDKDPLRIYTASCRRQEEKSSSFRSPADNSGASKRRGGVTVSAHEQHYTQNKAVSEDMKKKTFLPYRKGILGSF